MDFNTRIIHEGQEHDPATGSHVSPLYQTSTFILPNFKEAVRLNQDVNAGFSYSRFGSPTVAEFERKMAGLEGGEAALGTASGLAAISIANMSRLGAGAHLIFGDVIYGCSFTLFTQILPHYGVEYTIVDTTDLDAVKKAMRPNTKVIYAETPANPTLKITDIAGLAEIARSQDDVTLIVDSTFASPFLQNPLELGADAVVHSATKYLCGHGTALGGVIVGKQEFIDRCRMPFMQCFGSVLDPFAAWQIMQGMKTLAIRMERHCENAQKVAEFLEGHKNVTKVYYPGLPSFGKYHELAKKQMRGFGGMMSVDIKGGQDGAATVMESVEIVSLATSLGNIDSLIQHSPSMSHFDMTPEERHAVDIFDGQVRLSVGCECVDDLIADLDQALNKVKA